MRLGLLVAVVLTGAFAVFLSWKSPKVSTRGEKFPPLQDRDVEDVQQLDGVSPSRSTSPATKPNLVRPWQKIDGCTWKADRWNDGDSFHVLTGDEGREIVARLYFVDTPEAETAYRDRLNEQAAYFGITREQAVQIAHEAAAFTEKRLAAPFSVWTRWRSALGRSALGRNYCIIVTAEGRDLNELLVENGLARIYGTRTALFDGRDSHAYLARLAELETVAKRDHRGAWRFALSP